MEAGKSSRYGIEFERQVQKLLDAHGLINLRQNVYENAKAGKLDIRMIVLLEELRRVEKLNRPTK
jgi:hypothetical protein